MVKLVFIASLLAILPLVLSSPQSLPGGHVQSTFDLNSQFGKSNGSPFLGLRLIQLSENTEPVWMNEEEVMTLFRSKIRFMDVTESLELGTHYKFKLNREYPVRPSFSEEVHSFIGNLSTKFMQENLEKFTSFHNRYYRSQYGEKSSKWLFTKISDMIHNATVANLDVDVSVRKFTHSWPQKSIIARFEGTDPEKQNEVIIVGAHQDSINMWIPMYGRAPGADDDGSGTVTILEAFRTLVNGQFKPARPVEFHWYSAEEAGLLGSQAIALEYEKEGKDVIGMIQNDMTGFVGKNEEAIGIVNDYVNEELTTFVKKLVSSYSKLPYRETQCGYACSDHASWRKAGFPSAFAIEGDFSDSNPHIHSTNDLIKYLSFEHMLEFSKLSVSFVVELSHI